MMDLLHLDIDFFFDLVFGELKNSQYAALQTIGLTPDQAQNQGYFLIAKQVVDDVIQRYNITTGPNSNLKITGHSLGGTLASLMSMYVEDTYGSVLDTVVFSALGVRCLNVKFGWLIDKFRPQITNYYSSYDIVPAAGYQVGVECPFKQPDTTSYQACRHVFGFGTELYLSNAKNAQYTECNRQSHDFFQLYYQLSLNDDRLAIDGSTNLGCLITPFNGCPTYTNGADYVFFVMFWCFLALIPLSLFVLAIFACSRFIHIKRTKQRDAKIFWCCHQYSCGICCGTDLEEYNFEMK